MSAASVTTKLGFAAVLLPATAFIAGLLLQFLIPGCKCDEGAGCHGCGPLGELLGFLIFGGFVGALAALIFVLPVSLVLAAIFRRFAGKDE